jgi:NADPH2:quinone reductase
MKAIVIISGKEGGTLEMRDVPEPKPAPGEILLRVKATALNRADLYQRQGLHPTRTAPGSSLIIAGLEAAGEVAALGEGVAGFKVGDRVMALCSGSYAEWVAFDHRLAVPIPERLSWEEAATIPVSYNTEHNALITNARLKPGESVLINAASSGVGVAAVQISKLFGAKPIMGTGGSPEKLQALAELGMDVGINYRAENFADAALAVTKGAGVNVIIDHVGAPFLKDHLRCMALEGRLVSVGRLAGRVGELDLDFLALRRLRLIGVTFRTRTLEERIGVTRACAADLMPAFADGRLKPVINRVYPLHQALEAQAYMASNAQLGKIVLTV